MSTFLESGAERFSPAPSENDANTLLVNPRLTWCDGKGWHSGRVFWHTGPSLLAQRPNLLAHRASSLGAKAEIYGRAKILKMQDPITYETYQTRIPKHTPTTFKSVSAAGIARSAPLDVEISA